MDTPLAIQIIPAAETRSAIGPDGLFIKGHRVQILDIRTVKDGLWTVETKRPGDWCIKTVLIGRDGQVQR